MSRYRNMKDFPRTGEWVLLWDEEEKQFFPAFWDGKIDPAYPIRFLNSTGSVNEHYGQDWLLLDGFSPNSRVIEEELLSWLPWPTLADYPTDD